MSTESFFGDTPYNIFKKYEVKCNTVRDFLDNFCKKENFKKREKDFGFDLIKHHEDCVRLFGYTILSQYDSTTGRIVSFYS